MILLSAETVAFTLVRNCNMSCFATYCSGGWRVKVIYTFGSCEGGAQLWEDVVVKIYHFYELFTSVMPYPETTTQVFNLFLVKPCLENLHSSSGSRWTFVYFPLWLIDQTIFTIFQLRRYKYASEMSIVPHRNSAWRMARVHAKVRPYEHGETKTVGLHGPPLHPKSLR